MLLAAAAAALLCVTVTSFRPQPASRLRLPCRSRAIISTSAITSQHAPYRADWWPQGNPAHAARAAVAAVLNALLGVLNLWVAWLTAARQRLLPALRLFACTAGGDAVVVRPAAAADTPLVLEFIKELARFEQLEDQVTANVATLRTKLFPASPSAPRPRVLILEVNGYPAGFVLFFYNFSTFVGKSGIYIEDLYVREGYRGRGLGTLLLKRLCQLADEQDCGRIEWWCLDWNTKAIDFYLSVGAEQMKDWTVYRLNRQQIERLAASS